MGPSARADLARGILRRFNAGDTIQSVAERLDLPPRRVAEALERPYMAVRNEMAAGTRASDIAASTGLPRPFVVYAMRKAFAHRDRAWDQRRPS